MKTKIFILFLLSQYSAKSQSIRISPNYIHIGKSKFDSMSLLSDYYKVLGNPSRILNSTNNSSHNNYVFDSIGIAILEDKSKRVIEIRINVAKRKDWDFLPTQLFKGKIFLKNYGYYITENSSQQVIEQLCKKNKNGSFQFDAEDESSDFQYGAYWISFDHTAQNQKTATIYIDFNHQK